MTTNPPPDQGVPPSSTPVEAPPAAGAPDAAPPVAPWQAWEQAGITPDRNPYEVRQALDLAGRLTDTDLRAPTIEALARQAGLIPEGLRLQDLTAAAQALQAQREDPFQTLNPTPETGQTGQEALDAYQLREVWRQDMQAALQEERGRLQAELQQQQSQHSFDQASRDLQAQHQITPQALEVVRTLAATEIGSAAAQGIQMPHTDALARAYQQLQALTSAGVANAVQQAAGAPMTTSQPSAEPGAPKITSWTDAQAAWDAQAKF